MSPYYNQPIENWLSITESLIDDHPLRAEDIIDAVLESWNWIFESKIGNFYIGKDIFPTPQIMGYLLHELISLNLAVKFQGIWKIGQLKHEKDLVYIPNIDYSIEIKTSSNKNQIVGNRSYAKSTDSEVQKSKSGYYLTVNFDKFDLQTDSQPQLNLIRFGYIDHSDWLGQQSDTGQQARLLKEVYLYKLVKLYEFSALK